jgi:hypothetical protein
MNRNALLAIVGSAVTIVSLPFVIKHSRDVSAALQDDRSRREVSRGLGLCEHPLREVLPDRRVLILGDSMNLAITVFNDPAESLTDKPARDESCKVTVEVDAAAFHVAPQKREIEIPPGQLTKTYFNVSPKNVGTQVITVSAGGDFNSVGITVKDQHFMNRWQSSVLSIVSAVGGPMLTIPWWIEFIQKRKEKTKTRSSKGRSRAR